MVTKGTVLFVTFLKNIISVAKTVPIIIQNILHVTERTVPFVIPTVIPTGIKVTKRTVPFVTLSEA